MQLCQSLLPVWLTSHAVTTAGLPLWRAGAHCLAGVPQVHRVMWEAASGARVLAFVRADSSSFHFI